MKQRLDYIDRMKGFAILLMVLGHVYLFALHASGGGVINFVESCHMYIFMFMSGYVAYVADVTTLRHKLLKRIPTYIFPTFVLGWLLFPISVGLGINQWTDFVGTALTGGYWYLKCLAIFACLQYPILKCRRLAFEITFIIVVYILFIVLWKRFPYIATEQYIPFEHCACFYPSFVLGYYFRKYNLMQRLASANWLFTVALMGYIYLLFADIPEHGLRTLSERYIRPTLAIMFISYIFLQQEGKKSRFLNWLNWFGRNSLDVYLFNGLFVLTYSVADLTVLRDFADTHNMPLLPLLVAVPLSVGIAYICVGIGKLMRMSEFLKRWCYGLRNDA